MRTRRHIIIWVGMLLTVAASLTPLLAATRALGRPPSRWWVLAPAIATALLLVLIAPHRTRPAHEVNPVQDQPIQSPPLTFVSTERGWLTLVGVISATGSLVTILMITKITARPGIALDPLIAYGIAAAVVGVACVAFARGTGLAIDVHVLDSSGDTDAAAGRLLLTRLETLGSKPPRGLRTPEHADITALPEDALTSVPAGAFAKALFNIVRVVLPSAPWRVTVAMPNAACATWTITRNGIPVGNNSIVTGHDFATAGERGNSAVAADSESKDQMLTACAADTLLVLARRHNELRDGMCGADHWQSLALHAIAMRPGTEPAQQRRLLQASIDADPGYTPARLALVNTQDIDNPRRRLRYAGDLSGLYQDTFGADPDFPELEASDPTKTPPTKDSPDGYEAVQLRMLYSLAAGWYNVSLDKATLANSKEADRGTAEVRPDEAWQKSAGSCIELILRLSKDRSRDDPLNELIEHMRGPVANLLKDLKSREPNSNDRWSTAVTRLSDDPVVRSWREAPLRRRADFYSRACHLAAQACRMKQEQALSDLEIAVTDERLKVWARYDPSFGKFQQPLEEGESDDLQVQYKKIIGDPTATSYLDLPPFKDHADILRKFGLLDLMQLGKVAPRRLARAVGVMPTVARSWKEIAALAAWACMSDGRTDLGTLQVLLLAGVRDSAALRRAMAHPDEFYKNLVTAAVDLVVLPRRCDTVDRW